MTKETIRMIEEARNLSDSEWELLKEKLLKEDEIGGKVCEILKEVGMPANIKGYHYLKSAIILAYNDPTILDYITPKLYPEVAKEFHTTWRNAERCMRQAIERVFERGNMEKIFKIFKYTVSHKKGKLTNSEFIAGVVEYIRNS